MAVTKSWAAATPAIVAVERSPAPRGELVWLVFASLFIAAGLAIVYASKIPIFAAAGQALNINLAASAEELLPLLESVPDRAERESMAARAFDFLGVNRPLPNVGSLARLRRDRPARGPLLPMARLKPLSVVRTPREFLIEFLLWTGLYFAGFYLVAAFWRMSR